jgi:prepilin peptidase CpaA
MPDSVPIVIRAVLALLVIPAAAFDFQSRRVPNWLTLPALLLGIGLNVFLFHIAGLWISLEGLGLACLVYLPLYLLRGMGAGDVKLMAAVGAIVGPANWFGIFLLTSLLGGAFALVLIAAKGRFRQTIGNIWLVLRSLGTGHAPSTDHPQLDVQSTQALRLPHAAVIACGALGFVLLTSISASR